jgi:predicted dehydrogenase
MAELRVGVIGCGAIHSTHCDALSAIEGAKLSAVMDSVPERAKAVSEKYGVPGVNSLPALWKHVDAVVLAVPSGLHAKLGLSAANVGKHVISEKPIDVTLSAAKKLVEGCRAAGVTLSVISQHRFAQDIQRMRDAVQGGEIGKPLLGDAYIKWYRSQAYYDSGDWRGTWKLDGGGCLMNQGVHYVDMIQWIMGGIASVQAQVRTANHEIEVEDIATALVEYRNGAIGVIYGSTSVFPGYSERIEIAGSFGSTIIEGDRFKQFQIDPAAVSDGSKYGRGVQSQPTPAITIADRVEGAATGASDPSAIWGEQHRLQLQDVVKSIHDGREPFITGEMALEPLKVILAIYESAKKGGRRIAVAPPQH